MVNPYKNSLRNIVFTWKFNLLDDLFYFISTDANAVDISNIFKSFYQNKPFRSDRNGEEIVKL